MFTTFTTFLGDVEAALFLEPILGDQGEISKERPLQFCSRSLWYLYWQVDTHLSVFLLLITCPQFFCGSNLFSTRTPLNAWLLPLFWFFVQNSLSLFPSVVPARANACKCFPFAKDSEQHEKPSICKLQRSALTYSINSFNYSTMTVNFAWFLTTKPYRMHAVK